MKHILAIFAGLALSLGSLVFPGNVQGQTTTTGTIEGLVTDTTGAIVPNIAITLSGPNLIRLQTTNSNSEGSYRFLQIPPGRYVVTVAASSGFNSFQQKDIEVNLSKTTTVNIGLSPTGVGTSTVEVTAGTPEIDQTANTSGTNVSTEFFSNIPTTRTVQGLYTIAPTVARSGLRDASGRDRDPSVAGSSGPENNYILDGVTTTDPAFGGGGANLPFEFVQEVEIKTGSYGADQGLATGGIFNVITKSGGNEFHGDIFGYFSDKKLVRKTKNFPFTDLAPDGFSEIDAGMDIGGPIIKNKLTFFAAFNPQFRKNFYLTQTFRDSVSSKVTTPFYAGKITWSINNNNTFTFSTFGDFTKEDGHLNVFNSPLDSGFGAKENSFQGIKETGGTNYAFRLNSSISQNWIGEFSFGIHRQRSNIIPDESVAKIALVTDNFAILRSDGTVAPITQTGVSGPTSTGRVDYVYSPNGNLQRNYIEDGFGLYQNESRNRFEIAARLQNLWKSHTFKYGFEFYQNKYDINQLSTGPQNTFANPSGVGSNTGTPNENMVNGFRVTNNFSVCTTRGTQIVCPSQTAINVLNAAAAANKLPAGLTVNQTASPLTAAEANNNPFLVRTTTRVRDFELKAQTTTNVESFYLQDDWKITKDLQINLGARWDLQQIKGNKGITYISLNNLIDDLQPRIGLIYDFTRKGRGKFYLNYARYLETPIPLDLNVRAGSIESQTDKQFNVDTLNAPLNSNIATGFNLRNLGAAPTPVDLGLKPSTVNEFNLGAQYQFSNNLTVGIRGIYRAYGSVIEDGSFDNGNNYFIFNPGEIRAGDNTTEELACNNPAVGCFGRARRYYRALELTASKRFAKRYSFTSSYVFSSLIGNYEGLFRNDNGQADANITSLFDLVSLLSNTYGRLPNDRPHQFKFNGNYETPFKLMISGNFYIQSGIPFNQLIPDPSGTYGNNEGFGVPRGTAVIPNTGATVSGGSGGVSSAIGKTRTPTTWNLDLGAYYPIKLKENKQLRFTVDWFNVTNSQRAVTLDNTYSITLLLAGVPPIPNPFYGSGQIFQYPSSFRLGAKFIF